MKRIWLSLCLALCACGSGLQDTVKVEVEDDWTSPTAGEYLGILVTPDEVIVPVGSSVQLEALGLKDSRETVDLTDAVDWTSSAPSVASVSNGMSEEGTLTGVSAGSTIIVADFDGVESVPSRITVTDASLDRLVISPSSVTVGLWDTVKLSAEATFSDGRSSDASGQVRWITGDGSIVQFGSDGELEGVGIGSTTVSVEWDGVASDPIAVEVVNEVATASTDLYIDWVSGVVDDGVVEIIVSVHNDSDAPVTGVWVDLFIDPILTPTYGDWPTWYHMIEYIGPGESASVTMSASTAASSHDFAILIDSLDDVDETNESNNLYEGSTDDGAGSTGGGDVEPDGKANLIIRYAVAFSGDDETEYWIDVENVGDALADSFYVDVFHDRAYSDEPVLFEDGDAYHFFDEGLPAGETAYVTVIVDETCSDCGSWLLIDSYDMVDESDESDNTEYYFPE